MYLRRKTYHAVPKFEVPRTNGLTLTEAEGLRTLYLPKGVFGGGAWDTDAIGAESE